MGGGSKTTDTGKTKTTPKTPVKTLAKTNNPASKKTPSSKYSSEGVSPTVFVSPAQQQATNAILAAQLADGGFGDQAQIYADMNDLYPGVTQKIYGLPETQVGKKSKDIFGGIF